MHWLVAICNVIFSIAKLPSAYASCGVKTCTYVLGSSGRVSELPLLLALTQWRSGVLRHSRTTPLLSTSTCALPRLWRGRSGQIHRRAQSASAGSRGSWIANSTLVSFMCVRFDKFRSASADRHLQSHEFSLAPMLAFALPGLHL